MLCRIRRHDEQNEEAEGAEEEDILIKKNDALVLLKTIYTQEEVNRKYQEEQRDNRAQQQARDDVTEWFTLKQQTFISCMALLMQLATFTIMSPKKKTKRPFPLIKLNMSILMMRILPGYHQKKE